MSESYFSSYPLYLKPKDVMEIMQFSQNKAYTFMRELPAGVVFKAGKSVRVHRDNFFNYVAEQSGMKIPNS